MRQPDSVARSFVLYFDEPLYGLSVGAPVTLFGLPVGEVTSVGLTFDPATLDLRPRVDITVFPERLVARLRKGQDSFTQTVEQNPQKRDALMRRLVEERGLRAQLRTGSLLTGQMYVAFDYFPRVPKARVNWSGKEQELPVVPGLRPDLEARLTSILAKLDKLPLEAIGENLKHDLETLDQTLKSANRLVGDVDTQLMPQLKTDLEGLHRTLAAAERVLSNADATLLGPNAPAQQDLHDALQELARAARSLRALTDYLERHPESLIRGKTEQNSGRK
jgi:paraquat-inducible protein B